MSIIASTYVRKTFTVEAIQVTDENIKDVALWCGGTMAKTLDDVGALYIFVENPNPNYKRRQKAFVGDWVLVSDRGVRIYDNKAFDNAFQTETSDTLDTYAKVYQLVMGAMSKQDAATYHGVSSMGMDEVASTTTTEILGLL